MLKKSLVLAITVLLFFGVHATNVIFGSKSSTIQVDSGANLIIESALLGVDGTIIKDSNGNIGGAEITFENGSFVDGANKMRMIGLLDVSDDNKVILDGDKIFTGKSGSLYKQIRVSGKNNRIEGGLTLCGGVVLEDCTATVSMDLLGSMKENIELNGGTLYLIENDLKFDENKKIIGPGKVFLNGNKIIFGSSELEFSETLSFFDVGSIQFNDRVVLSGCWAFSGGCSLVGSDNILWLSGPEAKIIIDSGTSILFKSIVLHGVHTDNLFCMDDSCAMTFHNAEIYLDSDFTFSNGHFDVINSAMFFGAHKFIYNAQKQSTILSKSILSFDSGLTFSYDPRNMQKDLIVFQDEFSILQLNGATIHATVTGLQLTKGSLFVEYDSCLESENAGLIDEGITFGNSLAGYDCRCQVLRGAKLEVASGSIKNQNILNTSWLMSDLRSMLKFNGGTSLYLYEDLNVGNGQITFAGNNNIFNFGGKKMLGAMNMGGSVNYVEL